MSIATIAAAIASIGNGVSVTVGSVTLTTLGIEPPPAQIDTAHLPALYVITGEGSQEWSSDYGWETREYRVQCVVEAAQQATRETRESYIRALIVALRDKLAGYPNLGSAGVQNALVTSDTGPTEIQDRDRVFVGFELTITVTELLSRTYATGE